MSKHSPFVLNSVHFAHDILQLDFGCLLKSLLYISRTSMRCFFRCLTADKRDFVSSCWMCLFNISLCERETNLCRRWCTSASFSTPTKIYNLHASFSSRVAAEGGQDASVSAAGRLLYTRYHWHRNNSPTAITTYYVLYNSQCMLCTLAKGATLSEKSLRAWQFH